MKLLSINAVVMIVVLTLVSSTTVSAFTIPTLAARHTTGGAHQRIESKPSTLAVSAVSVGQYAMASFLPTSLGLWRTGYTVAMLVTILKRVSICAVGIVVGYVTILPHAMMADSGSKEAILIAHTAILASYFFGYGGLVGLVTASWYSLFPGLVLLVVAYPPLNSYLYPVSNSVTRATTLPSIMMADSWRNEAVFIARIAILGFYSFGIGALVGLVTASWYSLFPGLVLLVVAYSPLHRFLYPVSKIWNSVTRAVKVIMTKLIEMPMTIF